MTFFYNLNKTLDAIRAKPEITHGQLNERDEGKHNNKTTGFKALADKAAKEYGSKEAGNRVAGKIRADKAKAGTLEENAGAGYSPEMQARIKAATPQQLSQMAQELAGGGGPHYDYELKMLQQAKAELSGVTENAGAGYSPQMQARIKAATPQQLSQMAYELAGGPGPHYDYELKMLQQAKSELSGQMEEGFVDAAVDTAKQGYQAVKSGAQAALQAIGNTVGHGSDEDMIKKLQKDAGLPVTGKVPTQPGQQPAPGQQPMAEATAPIDFDKVLDAIAALYGDDMWENDAMQDLANDLEQAGPTDRELDFIIAKGKLPKRLAGIQFSAGDSVQFGESGKPMTPKQKSFAALAEPENEITFADKIAGAKKAVDEMLGDVAAEAMKNALSGGQKKLDKNMNGKLDSEDFAMLRKGGKKQVADEGFPTVAGARADAAKMKTGDKIRGHKGDIEKTSDNTIRHTRRYDDKTGETDTDDEGNVKSTEKRGRGRPKSADKGPERVTAKATKHKGGRKTNEAEGEGDDMVKLAKVIASCTTQAQLDTARRMAQNFLKKHQSGDLAFYGSDMKRGQAVAKDIASKRDEIGGIGEEAVSKKQQKFMGMVHAAQKGEKAPSKEVAKVAKTMKKGDAEDFASTKHKGLPEKKAKKEKTEETTVAGGMAPAAGGKSKGGSIVGKGIYDSLNRDLEAMINESMNVSVNMSQDEQGQPHKNITVSAEGEAAEQLAQLLNLAGMAQQSSGYEETCSTCGSSDCGCEEELDENQPDWPTDQETIGNDDPLMRRYAGGVNGPKSTGQADGAPPALQTQRQGVMGENKDLGMKLYAELKSFKG